jgi:hypothetical protein
MGIIRKIKKRSILVGLIEIGKAESFLLQMLLMKNDIEM